MIRRAIATVALVTFAQTGAALLLAGPPDSPPGPALPPGPRPYLNPVGVAVSADGRLAYVALSGADAVAEVDLTTGATLRRFPTGRNPHEVRWDGPALRVLDAEPLPLVISLPGGGSRRAMRTVDDGWGTRRSAHVSVPANRKVGGAERIVLTFGQEPAWHPNRSGGVTEAVFHNTLTANRATDPGASGTQFQGALGALGAIGFGGGALGVVGFGGGNNQTGLGYGGSGDTALTVSLDRATARAAQPAAAVWHAPSDTVFVAAAGADAVLAVRPAALRQHVPDRDGRPTALSALGGLPGWFPPRVAVPPAGLVKYRLTTQSNPRGLGLSDDGGTLVVSNTLSDSLTVVAVGPDGARAVRHVQLAGPAPDAARRGEALFHSARLSLGGRFACASCHPGGGGDGRAWETPTEDPGFARQTKPLFGVRDTASYGWYGDSPTLEHRVRKTLTQLHRHSPRREEVRDLVAYLESLDPLPPVPVAAGKAEAVARGRDLFEGRARCARCHAGDRLTDGGRHDVGTGGEFDTPSLRGVGRRWPLLHSGEASGPPDVFGNLNRGRRHGAAHDLAPAELADLLTFVKSL